MPELLNILYEKELTDVQAKLKLLDDSLENDHKTYQQLENKVSDLSKKALDKKAIARSKDREASRLMVGRCPIGKLCSIQPICNSGKCYVLREEAKAFSGQARRLERQAEQTLSKANELSKLIEENQNKKLQTIKLIESPTFSPKHALLEVDKILTAVSSGLGQLKIPLEIEIRKPITPIYTLTPYQTSIIEEKFSNNENPLVKKITLSNRMKVELKAKDLHFKIETIEDPVQFVSGTNTTTWSWNMTPLKGGDEQVTALIYALLKVDGFETPRVLNKDTYDIKITEGLIARISNFLGNNWQWLCGAIIFPTVVYFGRKYLSLSKKESKPRKAWAPRK
ncbi:hypothetical protein L0668_01850 [Paraglaciecola aquimarina]|uniref:Uncharacterized protein n=1 Tax=Paraglaciecola algarum TaxID=3050085 RepID=A0ABS9D2I0_9ALTE|nr:hypothetical protein [Paraglaciecola sp. G1-23]